MNVDMVKSLVEVEDEETNDCWDERVAQWRLKWHEYRADTNTVESYRDRDRRRLIVQQTLVQALQRFLDGDITLRDFNVLFQQQTHDAQNVFNLKGMSGGMFFNKLLKYFPDDELLARRLRSALPAPKRTREGQRAMLSLFRFLDTMIAQQQINREQIQPARVPFFLSAWWYLQACERWPIFYPLVHAVLMDDPQRTSSVHVIDEYFVFRARFLELAKALELSAWELEHLLTWYGCQEEARSEKRNAAFQRVPALLHKHEQGHVSRPVVLPRTDEEFAAEDEQLIKHEREVHTHVQWLLAKIGHKIGCTVWVAINDHQKTWKNERLGALSLPTLPFFTDSPLQHIIRRIDVLWIHQEKIVAAYEIEHTTDITRGLLRLYDLGALCEHAQYLCIVAPSERFQRIQFELARPVFHDRPMYEWCQLMSEELLLEHEEHILRWAGSLSIVESLLHPGDPKEI